jgi:hypothetical protein
VEAVADALARAVEFGIDWSERHSAPPNDCLRYGSTHAMCHAVTTGRISPWVIYNCESGQKFLGGTHSRSGGHDMALYRFRHMAKEVCRLCRRR